MPGESDGPLVNSEPGKAVWGAFDGPVGGGVQPPSRLEKDGGQSTGHHLLAELGMRPLMGSGLCPWSLSGFLCLKCLRTPYLFCELMSFNQVL